MLRKAIRTAQNFFPFLGEAKNRYYHLSRKHLGRVHDRDFAAIRLLPRRDDDVFIDVGGNRGQSILAIRHYRPDARIVSFEPNPVMFAWLQRHFAATAGIRLVACGLGPAHATHQLFVPSYRGFVYDGIASFSHQAASGYFGTDTLYFYNPAHLSIASSECVIETLDSFALAPSFVKIDVEGFEHDVLLGARETLLRHEPVLMLERYYGDERVRPLLEGLGYGEVIVRAGGFVPGASRGLNMILMTERRLHVLG